MGSKQSSNSATTSNTWQADNRLVAGEGAIALAAGANWTDTSRTSTTTTISGTDPGAVQFAQFAAELAGNVVGAQSDATKFMAASGAQLVRDMGESATNLYATAGKNNAEAWGETVKRADSLFATAGKNNAEAWGETVKRADSLFQATAAAANDRFADTVGASTVILGDTAAAAGRLADLAVTAYQPADAKAADTLKWGLIAAAALAALIVVPKIIK